MRFLCTLLLPILVGLIQVAYAATVVHDENFIPDAILHISEAVKKQSCVAEKKILLINGTSPGPELRFSEGKTVWIRVFNDIPDQNLTMHWHGLTLATAPFSDGTPSAAQWPIPPAHYFDYELNVPVGMAGTYFYHSHVGLQAISCTGPLIVEELDGSPPYHYDGERIVFLQDVFNQEEQVITEGLVHDPIEYEGDEQMVLINGKGAGIRDGVPCNDTLSVINVRPNQTYRFRFIGGTAITFASIGFEGHPSLDIIEADGSYTDKFNTSFIQIASGQRFSALLKTLKKPTKQQYFIQVETRERDTFVRSYAVLNYGPTFNSTTRKFFPPITPPINLPPTDINWLEYQLSPRGNPIYRERDLPKASEVTRRVNITVHLSEPGLPDRPPKLIYLQNGKTWGEDTVDEPYLVSLYKNNGKNFPSMERAIANDGLDPVTVAFPAKIGEVLEIVVQNTGSDGGEMETHPWHAHGAHYWDLGSGPGIYNQAKNEAKWATSPGKPVKRDTTMLFRNQIFAPNGTVSGWRAWRLRVTQPGVWMIHCHILPHMVFGMQTVWVMGNASEVMKADIPDVKGYLDYGGSVMGNETHFPEVVQFFDTWTETQRV